jgi:hypothetical protein
MVAPLPQSQHRSYHRSKHIRPMVLVSDPSPSRMEPKQMLGMTGTQCFLKGTTDMSGEGLMRLTTPAASGGISQIVVITTTHTT